MLYRHTCYQFIDGCGLFVRFVDSKKNIEYCQPYPFKDIEHVLVIPRTGKYLLWKLDKQGIAVKGLLSLFTQEVKVVWWVMVNSMNHSK